MDYGTLSGLVKSGKSIREIMYIEKVGYGTVRYHLKKLGIRTNFIKKNKSHSKCVLCEKNTFSGRRWCPGCCTKIRRVRTKRAAVALLGGKCCRCGWGADIVALEFHHPDDNKEFNVGYVSNRSWETVKREVLKCKLLCSNCHRVEHSNRGWVVEKEADRYQGRLLL